MSALEASVDELIAAGWGDVPRRQIPDDWQTRKPGHRKRPYVKRPYVKRKAERLEAHAALMRQQSAELDKRTAARRKNLELQERWKGATAEEIMQHLRGTG